MKAFKTTKDIVIPKGTEFIKSNITIDFVSGNYEAIIDDGKDGIISIFVSDEGDIYKELIN